MVRVWLGPFALSLVLWVLSRVQYHALLRTWATEHAAAAAVWSRDLWAVSDQVQVQRQERVLVLRREAFDAIARPLEPYVAVFVVFGIPAVVISTDFCQRISAHENEFCQMPCEMVLALRSTATGLVYFWQREHRQQLWHGGELWSRLRRRMCPCWCAMPWKRGESETLSVKATGIPRKHRHRKRAHVAFATELDIRLIDDKVDNIDSEDASTVTVLQCHPKR
eukprot:m.100236 g.100236  ORF g.100236 m.100236 type:complete len:223 (+) comp16780_c3_seq3:2-670(+)